MIDELTTSFFSTSTAGSFTTSSSVTITSGTTISSAATYYFSLYKANPIPSGSVLTIQLPSDIKMTSTTPAVACLTSCSGTTGTYPTINAYGGTLTISNMFTSYVAAGLSLNFEISSFTNPDFVDNFDLIITTYEKTSGTNMKIDESTLTITPTAGTLTVTSILPTDSTKIYDIPTSYTVTMTSTIAITSTTVLMLVFPSDF